MSELKQFDAITAENHSEIEEALIKAVNDEFRREEIAENYFKYIVELQGNRFITAMSLDEVEESARLTVDILEELKNINNSGINRAELERTEKEKNRNETEGGNVMQILGIWNCIKTDRLSEIIYELDRVRRVGGAWALLLANPCLISAIYAVYDRIVDSFDDDELYLQSAYFLMRAVMKMHSDEIADKEHSC